MENSPGIIFVKDREGRYLAVNRRFAKLYERDESDILGRTDYDLIHPAAAAQNRSTDMRVITSGLPIELEDAAMLSEEGRTLLVHKFPLRNAHGEIVGLCGLAKTSPSSSDLPLIFVKAAAKSRASLDNFPAWPSAG